VGDNRDMDSESDCDDPKQEEFLKLVKRFKEATDPAEAQRLGDQVGQMIFR
jgi:hypothetical protein